MVWSLYVWSTRIKNATGDDTLSSGSKAFSVVLSLTFLVFAVAGIVVLGLVPGLIFGAVRNGGLWESGKPERGGTDFPTPC